MSSMSWPLWLSLGSLMLGALGMAVLTPEPPEAGRLPGGPPPPGDWAKRVAGVVIGTESGGSYSAQNRNTDGAGLSFGILQWTQKSGSLGKILQRLHRTDPDAFSRIFGSDSAALLATTSAGSAAGRMAAVGGAVLWQAPWTARFQAAGQHEPFQAAQWAELFEGTHWQGAMKAATVLEVHTERAYALCFDRAVQQGPAAAVQIAEQLRARLTANGAAQVSYSALLAAYAQLAAARFQRVDGPGPSGTWHWNPDTHRWHRFAGDYDLFALVSKRTGAILSSRRLSDLPLA